MLSKGCTQFTWPFGSDFYAELIPRRGMDKVVRQVFWLPDQSTLCTFPPDLYQAVVFANFVSDYSGGTTPDFHGIPY